MHVVITSKEDKKIPTGISARVEVKADVMVWKFATEEKANDAAKKFMEAGFEYVQREVKIV